MYMATVKRPQRKTPYKKKRVKKTQRRVKKSRYLSGVCKSEKCLKPIHYRSGWEKSVIQWFTGNNEIESFIYEGLKIPYVSNKTTGKIRNYIPDFLVKYKNGTIKLIEVKRADKVNEPKTAKKLLAGKIWCEKNNMPFEVWTDEIINKIRNELLEEQNVIIKRVYKKRSPAGKE